MLRLAYYTGWDREAIRALPMREFNAYQVEIDALRAELLGEAIVAAVYPHLGVSDKGKDEAARIQRQMRDATDFRTLEERGAAGRKALREMLGKKNE